MNEWEVYWTNSRPKPVIKIGVRFAAHVSGENAVLEIGFPDCRTAQDRGGLNRDLLAGQYAADLRIARQLFNFVQIKIHMKRRLHLSD
jgi:hypothetical protein